MASDDNKQTAVTDAESASPQGATVEAKRDASDSEEARTGESDNAEKTQPPAPAKGTQHAVTGAKRKLLVVVLVVCLIGVACGIAYFINYGATVQNAEQQQSETSEPATPSQVEATASSNGSSRPDNPIDFDTLKKKNKDIYAWINVPGTRVNYAVVQHPKDNQYYLKHNADGDADDAGAIFSELYNTKTFTDPVTMLYGHYGFGGAMFTTLHDFEKADFFKAHDKFYIYTPHHIYTYKIVSAYMTDDRHIFSVYDFSKKGQLKQFEHDIMHPSSVSENVRKNTKLSAKDTFVVLSTCNSVNVGGDGRYLVCGVKTNDTKTK